MVANSNNGQPKEDENNKPDGYLTVKSEVSVRYPVGKCRFIASVAPVMSEGDVRNLINKIKEEYPDATHHAWAYRIGWGNEMCERYSDDREPAGTAGPPLLSAIKKAGLTNILVIVTRYFGGIKLGVGGLIRAYRGCAEEGIKNAVIVRRIFWQKIRISMPYQAIGIVMRIISTYGGEITNLEYGEEVHVELHLNDNMMVEFINNTKNATSGQAIFHKG